MINLLLQRDQRDFSAPIYVHNLNQDLHITTQVPKLFSSLIGVKGAPISTSLHPADKMEKNGAAMQKIHILSISTNSEIITLTLEYSFDLSVTLFVLEHEHCWIIYFVSNIFYILEHDQSRGLSGGCGGHLVCQSGDSFMSISSIIVLSSG